MVLSAGNSGAFTVTANPDGNGTVTVHWDPVGGYSYAIPPSLPVCRWS